MRFLIRKLNNGRKAIFIVTKQNRKHIKFMLLDDKDFSYFKGGNCRWINLGLFQIKTKGI
jgi:hypothetical protein